MNLPRIINSHKMYTSKQQHVEGIIKSTVGLDTLSCLTSLIQETLNTQID